jgi:hypothetical protein
LRTDPVRQVTLLAQVAAVLLDQWEAAAGKCRKSVISKANANPAHAFSLSECQQPVQG